MSDTRSIGVFDSGIGGTSIWREVRRLLPNESTLYLADSANAPYGPKGRERIVALSVKNTELLLSHHCKLIVVACNTATTNAIAYLRAHYPIPFIGIEPAIKPAVLRTKTGVVGILATKGTLGSDLFYKTANLHAANIRVVEQDGEGLVTLIEAGKATSEETRALLHTYLAPMLSANIDHLVLGCSHYPYLIPVLRELLPSHITIIDSGAAVAKQTKAVLESNALLNRSKKEVSCSFFTNGNPEVLQSIVDKGFSVTPLEF